MGAAGDWKAIVAQADEQLILPALGASLDDLGLFSLLDEELAAFLRALHQANAERNNLLREELVAAARLLNQAGIEPVLLEGAIRLTDDLYPDQGWRMLRDLDLLIERDQATVAMRHLSQAGYAPHGEINKEAHLVKDGTPFCIDLHWELFSTRRRERLLGAREVLHESRTVTFRGARVRLPSTEHQMIQLIGHKQIQDQNHAYGRVVWRDWLEASALARWGSSTIDWRAISARFAEAGYGEALGTFAYSMENAGLPAIPAARNGGLLATLHRFRLKAQAHSRAFERVSFGVIWAGYELKKQLEELDGTGRRRIVGNAKRVTADREAVKHMTRALFRRAPWAG